MGLRGNNYKNFASSSQRTEYDRTVYKDSGRATISILRILTNKSKGKYAYTMIDIDSTVSENVIKDLGTVEEVLRIRVIS